MAPELLARRLLFVTGKGGVGKTTVAAALATLGANQGRRVLLCDAEGSGDLAACLECGPLGFAPREVADGLFAMSMDTEAALGEYLRLQLHLPTFGGPLGVLAPLARTFEFLATAAPGIREILTVGKLCYEVRADHFDLVVVDAASSGHVLGELSAPAAINELVRFGAIKHQTAWMVEMLGDPKRCAAVLVATPEEMPVAEAIDLAEALGDRTEVHLGAVVANRVLPELFARAEAEVFDSLREPGTLRELTRALGADRGATATLLDAAALAVRLRRRGAEHLERLRGAAGTTPLVLLPYLFARPSGARAVRVLAEALSEELE